MKKKAGQASEGAIRPGSKSNQLAVVRNSDSKKLAAAEEEKEFYKSLATGSSSKSGGSPSKNMNSGKKSSSTSSKSGSGSAKSTVRKSSASKSKKKIVPILAAVAAVLLVGGGIFAGLYFTGFFEPKVEITLPDGTVTKMKVDAVYSELTSDKFFPGTIVDGIDVGGMTIDQAYDTVSASLPEKPLTIDIKLKLVEKTLNMDFSDAQFSYNTREVLEEAFAKFRPQNNTDLVALAECYVAVQNLKTVPQEYETAYTIQVEGIAEQVRKILGFYLEDFSVVSDATIESFDPETCEYTITPEKVGYDIDVDATAAAVKELFDAKIYTGVVEVPTVVKNPTVTEAMIRENFGLISESTTEASSNSNRNNNISQACKNMNGTILEPGEEFSFNGVVGQRTAANGFKEATVIQGGQYEQGLGGGICQVSSTLYNAVLKADLEVTTRSGHAWPSDYVLKGLDATVDWPALDFKFKNNTDYQVVVVAWFDWSDNTVHTQIYGKKLADGQYITLKSETISTTSPGANEYVEDKTMKTGEKKTLRDAHYGYTVKVYKVWHAADGTELSCDEYYTTSYRSYGKRIAVGTLNPDGTYATFDKSTGEITSTTVTPTPEATPSPAPTDAPAAPTSTPTPAPAQDTPTPAPAPDTPTPVPENPDPGSGGGEPEGGGDGNGG